MAITNKTGRVRNAVVIASALAVYIFPLGAVAMPNVDGRIDPTEGYSEAYDVSFNVEGDKKTPGGQVEGGKLLIHVDQATGDVYVAFSQPTDLVDNSYGANSVGWGSSAPSGKNHNFKDLKGSDKALFLFKDDQGGRIVDVMMDYLYETACGYDSGIEPGKESYVLPGTLESMVTGSTSLDYNLNTLGYDLTEDSPETKVVAGEATYELVDGSPYTGWLFDVIYEMKIAGEVFDSHGGFSANNLTIDVVHDSPNKIGKNAVIPEIGSTNPGSPVPGVVPEPVTMLAVIAGLGALGGYLRKRRGATAS